MNVRVDLYCTEFILRMRMCVVVSCCIVSPSAFLDSCLTICKIVDMLWTFCPYFLNECISIGNCYINPYIYIVFSVLVQNWSIISREWTQSPQGHFWSTLGRQNHLQIAWNKNMKRPDVWHRFVLTICLKTKKDAYLTKTQNGTNGPSAHGQMNVLKWAPAQGPTEWAHEGTSKVQINFKL